MERKRQNWKLSFSPGNLGQLFQFCPGRTEAVFYTLLSKIKCISDQNVSGNIKKPIILTFFTLPQIWTSWHPKFDNISLCVHYWRCIIQSLLFPTYFLSKVNEEKPFGVSARPRMIVNEHFIDLLPECCKEGGISLLGNQHEPLFRRHVLLDQHELWLSFRSYFSQDKLMECLFLSGEILEM